VSFNLVIQTPQPLQLVVQSPPEIKSTLVVGQGPAGASGGASLPPFQFLTPIATWVINHNLGRRPLVGVFSVGGVEMMAEVIHTSVNQVQVIFDNVTAGYAVCS
jgi:hypothetical protein